MQSSAWLTDPGGLHPVCPLQALGNQALSLPGRSAVVTSARKDPSEQGDEELVLEVNRLRGAMAVSLRHPSNGQESSAHLPVGVGGSLRKHIRLSSGVPPTKVCGLGPFSELGPGPCRQLRLRCAFPEKAAEAE